jgi:hypothetical protein
MIRNVVVHIANEQPVLADLLMEPKPSDVALICSNLRTMGGKKPVFIDKTESTFILPLAHIRFVEIPQASMVESAALRAVEERARPAAPAPEPGYEAVPLARLAWLSGVVDEPPQDQPDAPAVDEPAIEEPVVPVNPDELDPELLRKIHEV